MESSKKSNGLTKRYDKRVKIFVLNNILSNLPDYTESLKTQIKTNGDK
jgi:hypothetical protein